jgi:hypothetical protein
MVETKTDRLHTPRSLWAVIEKKEYEKVTVIISHWDVLLFLR